MPQAPGLGPKVAVAFAMNYMVVLQGRAIGGRPPATLPRIGADPVPLSFGAVFHRYFL